MASREFRIGTTIRLIVGGHKLEEQVKAPERGSECPTGIQRHKEEAVSLEVTFQRAIIVDPGLAIIGIHKVSAKLQTFIPLIGCADGVAKLSVYRHVRGPIFAVHRAVS